MKGNELKLIKKEHCFVRYLTKECKGMMWKRTRNNSQYVELGQLLTAQQHFHRKYSKLLKPTRNVKLIPKR